jgi:hypothetical protein
VTSTFEPRHLDTWGNFNVHAEGLSDWSAGGGTSARWGHSDVRALRGGPALRTESSLYPWAYVASNPRRRVNARIDGKGFWQPVGSSWLAGAIATVATRVGDHLELSTGVTAERRIEDAQFVDTFIDGADAPHWVVGRIDQTTMAFTLRGRLGLSPDLSVDLYAQPFVSRGDFGRYREVTDASATRYEDRFSPTAPGAFPGFEAADFRFRELRSNLVLRWEFRPGSVGLLVWSHGRTSDVLRDDIGGDIDALTADGEDVVLLKVSYWFAP